MPRKPRYTPGGYCYHVVNRGVGKMRLFDDPGDYLAFLQVLAQGLQRHPQARLLAYCLMPNHWHLVLWPEQQAHSALSELMQWVGTTHVRRWHKHRHSDGSGPIYQGRFKSFPIQGDRHLFTVCRYVERNALRAGLVPRAEQWRWGSLWLNQQQGGLETPERVLQSLIVQGPAKRPDNWLELVNQPQSQAEVDALRRCVNRGTPYGENTWVHQTAEQLGIAARERGRPKKRK